MYKYVLTTAAALIFAGSAHAALIGSMELVDTGVAVGNSTPVDVYNFVVTSTAGDGLIDTFDFTSLTGGGFSGQFVVGPQTFSTSPNLPNFGILIADSFFVSPVANPSAVGQVDTSTALEAAFSFTAAPLDASGGVVAAVFSVPAGAPAPSFNGGFAVVDGADVPIVPEPASLAMIGLGGLALLRRRVA